MILAERGLGDEQRLLGTGQRRFLRGNVRIRFHVFALGNIDLLLRDQFRTRFLNVGETRVGEMRDGVGRLGAIQIFPRARQFLIAAADGGFILLQLLLEFRNFQHGEDLPLLYVSSVVDVEFLNVAGNFGVHVDFLKRLEFGGDFQFVRNVASRHFHDGCRGSVCPSSAAALRPSPHPMSEAEKIRKRKAIKLPWIRCTEKPPQSRMTASVPQILSL